MTCPGSTVMLLPHQFCVREFSISRTLARRTGGARASRWSPDRSSRTRPTTLMSHRSIATALAVAVMAWVAALAQAGPADYVMPIEKHSTAKGRALATKYQPQLLQFSDY